MGAPLKHFVMRLVVDDVSNYKDCHDEIHYDIQWELSFKHTRRHIDIEFYGIKGDDSPWKIRSETTLKVISENGACLTNKKDFDFGNSQGDDARFEWSDVTSRSTLSSDYAVDGKVIIEASVIIKEMIGFDKEDLRKFDESIKKFSDVVIVVKERKFYLSKLFLGLQSSYFDSLLLGNFEESQKSEIVLNDINPTDFQNFLELIHGEDSINSNTIDGILHLADMYDTPTAIKRCETFLLNKSNKTLKMKLEMSIRYNLNDLKKQCLSRIETVAHIRSVMPENIDEMDPSVSRALLLKSMALH
ncbi:hypothetical protein CRE_21396 [Caenorhabditis remanei]|uniref:BTB domain-containing protein n=1 Tax=Caenorhabditis remanei TaxID=31234 RepID=E3MUQ4_CAERE|nr:hypothetical protein CRE_21396 [Caenorhabditis remanei]